jgi:hypothetical protein
MSQSIWGPPTWKLFHTLIEKITDENLVVPLFQYIVRICYNLPCPDCSSHSKTFFSKINQASIKTKTDLRNLMYIFHNMVNRRKNKPMFHVDKLVDYKNNNTIQTYNQFINVYQTRGNMKLIADSLQRQLLVKEFKKWVTVNIRSLV